MTAPNQRTIKIVRDDIKKGEGKQFLAIYCENVALASRTLNGEVPFKLYLYLASNANNYVTAFSPQHFSSVYGVSADAARKAFAKLIDAGYLIETSSNHYDFYEVPQQTGLVLPTIKEEKRYCKDLRGNVWKLTYNEFWKLTKDENSDEVIKQYWEKLEVVKDAD